MKIYELLSEKQLDELNMKSLGKVAAAGIVGGALMTTPMQDDPVKEPTEITQQAELPKDLEKMSIIDKKKAFIDSIVPIAKKVNVDVLQKRNLVISLSKKQNFTDDENEQLKKLMSEYKADSIDSLLTKIDIIPVSLILSQAIIESGWGTSRFAKQGNSLFGQRGTPNGGMKPKDSENVTVAKFDNIADSVKSYLKNLNTHRAYREFRSARKQMRDSGKNIDSLKLAKNLKSYSERGSSYIKDLTSIIKYNKLSQYDT